MQKVQEDTKKILKKEQEKEAEEHEKQTLEKESEKERKEEEPQLEEKKQGKESFKEDKTTICNEYPPKKLSIPPTNHSNHSPLVQFKKIKNEMIKSQLKTKIIKSIAPSKINDRSNSRPIFPVNKLGPRKHRGLIESSDDEDELEDIEIVLRKIPKGLPEMITPIDSPIPPNTGIDIVVTLEDTQEEKSSTRHIPEQTQSKIIPDVDKSPIRINDPVIITLKNTIESTPGGK